MKTETLWALVDRVDGSLVYCDKARPMLYRVREGARQLKGKGEVVRRVKVIIENA